MRLELRFTEGDLMTPSSSALGLFSTTAANKEEELQQGRKHGFTWVSNRGCGQGRSQIPVSHQCIQLLIKYGSEGRRLHLVHESHDTPNFDVSVDGACSRERALLFQLGTPVQVASLTQG